jgi:hypothetical protein
MPLEALVPDEIASTCRTYRAERQGLAKGLSDALLCNRSGGFGPARVLYFRYVDRAALLAAFNWLTGSTYVRGPCEAGGQEASYRTTESGLVVGVLRCYGVNRLRILAWTHEDLRVLAVAEDELLEFGVLAQWWQTAGPYLDPDRLPRSFLAG